MSANASLTPRIVDETAMTAGLDQAIRSGLCRCFAKDAAVFSQTRAWHGSAPAFSAIIEVGQAVIAHVGVVDRVISIGGRSFRVGGVQNVFVASEYRGRGLSNVVMTAAMQQAAGRGLDMGLLFCQPKIQSVYDRGGWQLLSGRTIYRVDEHGTELPLPASNVAMYFPLKSGLAALPDGDVHLQGNDW